MDNFVEFLDNVNTLSSTGLVADLLGFFAASGKWAGAVADLLGLVK